MNDLPLPPAPIIRAYTDSAKAWGIVSIVTGILGWLLLPILFGPIALVSGIVAVNLRYQIGWWGIGLGAAQLAYVAYALAQFSEALSNLS